MPQLLVALKTLWNVGVLHTDIKPDNVMLVNSKEQPLRIKLIDFGLAILISKAKPGMLTQPIGYRYFRILFLKSVFVTRGFSMTRSCKLVFPSKSSRNRPRPALH